MLQRFVSLLLLCQLMPLCAQVCRLSVAGLNRNRKVVGEITAECPSPIHTAPFGNWGATSNFGTSRDGHQFDGWCHEVRVCDNAGNCRQDCNDGWYEWNSCTNHQLYKAPNCSLFNSNECTEQVSTTGINVLGTQTVDIPVSCPMMTEGSGTLDRGGCSEVLNYSRSNNFMSLYELDPVTGDELVQSVYYPGLLVPLKCNAWGCPSAGSDWAEPVSWDSPKSPAKVFAEMAMIVNSGTFVDSGNSCRVPVLTARVTSSATLDASVVAGDSLVTLFTGDVTALTESASGATLPSTLGGIEVRVTDSANTSRMAQLLYVSPRQVNLVMPAGLRDGAATLAVLAGNTVRASGTATIERVRPGVFTADASGRGVAAAVGLRIAPEGTQQSQISFDCASGTCAPVPLDLGSSSEQFFLVLFATGIRGRTDLANVAVTVGGVPLVVSYAGAQPTYAGLDQVNVAIPRSLSGRGLVEVRMTVDGKEANPVLVWIR